MSEVYSVVTCVYDFVDCCSMSSSFKYISGSTYRKCYLLFHTNMFLFSWLIVFDSLPPMNWSTPDFPVLHYLPELVQTHVPWVSDAIQPSHPLSPPSLSAINLSQHQGLFQRVSFFASGGQSIGASASASVLPMNIQSWFFKDWLVWSPCFKSTTTIANSN